MGDGGTVLLLGFGQSNADVHDHGPRLVPEIEDALPIVVPNDGAWVRGHMGRPRTRPITGFDPISTAPAATQSMLAAAAARLLLDLDGHAARPARVIVRSAARGGRRFLGLARETGVVDGIFRNPDGATTTIFEHLILAARECVAAARADGSPVTRIEMMWQHGESDRAMPRADYAALLFELIDTVAPALADLGVPIRWNLVQPGGTGPQGAGNHWPNRLSLWDVADARANVEVAAPAYAYPLCDASHFSADGKLWLGETLGHRLARRLRGETPRVPRIRKVTVEGSFARLTFAADDPLEFDARTVPPPHDTVRGFHTRDRARSTLLDATVSGPAEVDLRFDRSPDPETLMIHYAYRHCRRDAPDAVAGWPVARGTLRTTRAVPSKVRSGRLLHDWVAAFSVRAAEMATDRPAR